MDKDDDLKVLRHAMELATAVYHYGSFYDPRDPTRDYRIMLDEFKHDKSIPLLEIGIRYGWDSKTEAANPNIEGAASHGTLWICKNRLPPEFDSIPVQPPITEGEVRGVHSWSETDMFDSEGEVEAFGRMMQADLGGVGCCDCCHVNRCNFGAKFPHLSFTGYMWLTPKLFTSLSRLGHAMSDAVIQRMLNI
eukprot:TRINITY_DN12232_c3_g1_i1.p1 TRINITY_DN12232_c3_g1~~TRINITY_DN12232_c3_g1_i1.p1  ORF type:complete len:208 (-),score=30.59 TRINITY_DN12232_c3_g1_i1:88-663(-)